MKKIYVIVVFLFSLFYSCENYTDIQPRGISIPTNLKDIDLLLNDGDKLSGTLTLSIFPILISDNIYIPKLEIDLIASEEQNIYMYNAYYLKDKLFPKHLDDVVWEQLYQGINYCNFILRTIEKIKGDKTIKNQYKAEALTHRSFFYFVLVNTYGQNYGHPDYEKPNTGVPIIKEFANIKESLKRMSVKKVYEFILNDLLEAEKIASNNLKHKMRINKNKVRAMLAKVYFHMGNLKDAKIMVDQSLNEFNTLLDYDKIDNIPLDIRNNEAIIFKIGQVPNNTFTYGMPRISSELLKLYDTKNDLRLIKFCDKEENGDYIYQKIEPFYKNFNFGLSVPELLLIKAEILARTNKYNLAMDELNKLRAKRYSADAVNKKKHILTAKNEKEAIQHVINERRREFHVKARRFFDIKRLNALYNANISLTRENITFKPNGLNWALPISYKVIKTSEGQIKQNKRD